MRLLTRPETLLKKQLENELKQKGKLSKPDKILYDAISTLQDKEKRLNNKRAKMEALAAKGHLTRLDQSKLDRLEQFAANEPLDLAPTVSERLAKVEKFTKISGQETLGNFEKWHKAQLDKYRSADKKPEENKKEPLRIGPRPKLKKTGTDG